MTLAPETTTTLTVRLRPAGPDGTAADADADWFAVCDLSVLIPGRGVAALLPDGRQVALFMDRTGRMYGIDNRDPFSGAAVLSRGLTGSHQGRPFVASPLLKQRFDLESGRCLDDESVAVTTYEVRAG
ncbi:nitrite reductase (NADH) small subunit [Streptomyces sp. V3I8]|uniref:nitrite reductase small subunit NirD n=1 Tax=Streptomyces sp. V3I8 TaxID=3042279 RepID=UPI00278697EF|nr:nitrite reductase small subunit NirD [Streptomyces sp. V3I8]MDQ1038788.1 nitrite reductase (NADH) small subunit [Streptomyces sp. V3I8]